MPGKRIQFSGGVSCWKKGARKKLCRSGLGRKNQGLGNYPKTIFPTR
jgi:hypothetical protein